MVVMSVTSLCRVKLVACSLVKVMKYTLCPKVAKFYNMETFFLTLEVYCFCRKIIFVKKSLFNKTLSPRT